MTEHFTPKPWTEWFGVAVDAKTGQTIRQAEDGQWVSNERWLGGSCESDPLGCAEIINGACPSCGRVFPDVVERLTAEREEPTR